MKRENEAVNKKEKDNDSNRRKNQHSQPHSSFLDYRKQTGPKEDDDDDDDDDDGDKRERVRLRV